MCTTTRSAIVVCLLLTSTRSGTAQTIAIQNELEAVLALERAGALVVCERGVAVKVSLSGLKTADRLLRHVKVLSNLESLELAGTDITDESLGKINGLTKLRSINLASSQVGDKGLEHLKNLTGLTSLSLYGTKVSDEGIGQLKALNKLGTLIVKDTKVTSAGAGKLLEVLPKVSIIGIKEWETGYVRVEMEGTLLKEIIDKKEHWSIKVKTARLGEISWPLDFLENAEMQRAAQRLEKKAVIITGEIVRDIHFPGVGGESFLVPSPEPKVLVRTLRAAEKE
jgi:hypothetical protein